MNAMRLKIRQMDEMGQRPESKTETLAAGPAESRKTGKRGLTGTELRYRKARKPPGRKLMSMI